MPFLSVVIPVHNASPFLSECLESLRAQDFRDWEALCVDDGSTDDSAEILREYEKKDSRFVVISKTNSGYGAAVNLGLSRARGDYAAILEPDDRLASADAYSALAAEARRSRADAVKGDYNFWWSRSGRKRPAEALRACPKGVPLRASACRALFALPLSVWSAFYRTAFLRERGIAFLETPGASFQDNAFSFKVFACAERVVLLDVPVTDYRQDNANSSMKAADKKAFCIADELHEIERWLGEDAALRERFAYDFFLFKYKAYFANLLRLSRERQKEFLELFVREFRAARSRGELPQALFPRLGRRLPLLLSSPEKFLRYARIRAAFDKFRCFRKNFSAGIKTLRLLPGKGGSR